MNRGLFIATRWLRRLAPVLIGVVLVLIIHGDQLAALLVAALLLAIVILEFRLATQRARELQRERGGDA